MRIEVFRVADDGFGVYDVDEGLGREVSCALPLGGLEGAFGLVVLAELGLDVVVDALYFLFSLVTATARYVCNVHLLQCVYKVCNRLVCPVLDLVPLEVAQILVDRLYVM